MELHELNALANKIRIDIVQMIAKAGSGHPGGSLSSADILCALYFGNVLEHSPDSPCSEDYDRFILAKGHAAPALYATLAHAGYFPREELATLRKLGARLQGHPDSRLVPGVEVSTGSLGQGLSIASGLACALKIDNNPHQVFTLLGDGECQEGQVWEAAMFAAHQHLDNLIAIVDRNDLQIDGNVSDVCDLGDLSSKFISFGWDVAEVDGHNIENIIKLCTFAKMHNEGKPHMIIAHTTKGKGVSFMENQAGWHGVAPDLDQLKIALEDLHCTEEDMWFMHDAKISVGNDCSCKGVSDSVSIKQPVLLDPASKEAHEKKATRAALGITLAALSAEGKRIAAVDADLSGSTTTKKFALASEENAQRFFNVGIAEQNMIDVAAGLSLKDYSVYTGSFAVFGTGRTYDQIRNTVCYSNLNVKITPTHAGISVGPDGGSHQMLEDIAIMRALPNMRILVPADYAAACSAIKIAAQTEGPVYIRMGRAAVPRVYAQGTELQIGGAYRLREGDDVTIVACGVEVEQALKAAETLHNEGIEADVIDAFSVKPLAEEVILESVAKTGCVVSVEEHSIIGGLGAAICELLSKKHPVPVEVIGIKDCFGKSGSFDELLTYFGLDSQNIVEGTKRVLARK